MLTLKRSGLILSALLVATLACSIPLFERAEVTPGLSVVAGAGVASGRLISGYSGVGNIRPPVLDYAVCPVGLFRLSQGLSPNYELFLQGAAGPGSWLISTDSGAGIPFLYDVRVGGKVRVGRNGAARIGIGMPGFLDADYLYDFNRHLTGTAGLGFRGFSLGLSGRLWLTRSVALVTAGNAVFGWEYLDHHFRSIPAASLGLAIEASRLD